MNVACGVSSASMPCWSSAAKAVSPSTHSTFHDGLFFSAATRVSSGPVESSTSLTGMPVAFWNALVTAES